MFFLSCAQNNKHRLLSCAQNDFVVADMKYIVSITGSNSKMLSSEIASTLGCRFVIMNIS